MVCDLVLGVYCSSFMVFDLRFGVSGLGLSEGHLQAANLRGDAAFQEVVVQVQLHTSPASTFKNSTFEESTFDE